MRIDLLYLPQPDTRMHDQVMLHTQRSLGGNLERVSGKQIEILMDAPGQSIFNRDYRALRFSMNDCRKRFVKREARQRLYFLPENFFRSMMAERTQLSLERYLPVNRQWRPFFCHTKAIRLTIYDLRLTI
jgi:hypothetical protein